MGRCSDWAAAATIAIMAARSPLRAPPAGAWGVGVQAGELETLQGTLADVGIGTLGADRIISVQARCRAGRHLAPVCVGGRWRHIRAG